jgi:predicted ATPase
MKNIVRHSTNNWIVITGGPSSGKTTVLQYLEKKGHRVEYEIARKYIDEEMKKGKTLNEIRKNEKNFQIEVLKRKITFEKSLPEKETIFLEIGLPDSAAYFSLLKTTIGKNFQKAVNNSAYKKVFILEMLPYKKDYARTEDKHTAERIERLLIQSYEDLMYKVIRVPRITVAKRAKYILDTI